MVRYTIYYLKGAALDWFEPIIMGKLDKVPAWLHDYSAFVQELVDHFGPYDFCGDAETSLSNLTMKDMHQIARYTIEFNKLAAQTDWNEPTLCDRFFQGLPLCLHTDLLHGGKPSSLTKIHQKAQKYDQAYWLMKDKAAKSVPPTSSISQDKEKSLAPSDKKPFHSSSAQSSSHLNNLSSMPKSGSSSMFKKDLTDKLGKDGRLHMDK